MHALDEPCDGRRAIKVRARPGSGKVTPLHQLEACSPQTLDRTILVHLSWPERTARAPKRSPYTLGRILELLLKPGVERFPEETPRLSFGQYTKQRIDPRFD